jgi:hypothetical protein
MMAQWQWASNREERHGGAKGVVGAGAGRVVEVHRRGVELEEATVGRVVAGGGGTQWTGVRWLPSAWCEEKTEMGHERKTEVKKGELIGGVLPL